MRLLLSVATFPLLIVTSNGFTFPVAVTKRSRKLPVMFVIKDDPYVDPLVKAYQKKAPVPVPDAIPEPPPPVISEPTPEVSVDAAPTVPDIPEVKEAAKEIVKAVSEKSPFNSPIQEEAVRAKVPTLGEMLTQRGYQSTLEKPSGNFDESVAIAKEKWALIQENLSKFVSDVTDVTVGTKDPMTALSESAKGVEATATKALSQATDAGDLSVSSIGDFLDKLHLDEYGAFILAALALLVAAQQRNAGKAYAEKQLAEQLANADEETLAAIAAAFEKEKIKKQLEEEKASLAEKKEAPKPKEPEVEQVSTKTKVKGAAKPAAKKDPVKKTAPAKKKAAKAKSTKKSAPAKKKATTKKASKAKVTTDEGTQPSENPWAALSDSSLMRKTAKELADYLTERGVNTIGDNGKLLRKADMVSAIKSL